MCVRVLYGIQFDWTDLQTAMGRERSVDGCVIGVFVQLENEFYLCKARLSGKCLKCDVTHYTLESV